MSGVWVLKGGEGGECRPWFARSESISIFENDW